MERVLGALERIDRARPSTTALTVLTYHRVLDPNDLGGLDPSMVSATPEGFEAQMAYVADHCHPLALDEVFAAARGRRVLSPRSVLVTFDDAYRDVATHAWPVLRRRSIPLTVFVPTAFPGNPARSFWWDRLHHAFATTSASAPVATPLGPVVLDGASSREAAFRRVRDVVVSLEHEKGSRLVDDVVEALEVPNPGGAVLGWDDLRGLAREGVDLVAHSRTHPLLDRLPPARLEAEIAGSREDLEREVGPTAPVFAYPGGRYDDGVIAALAQNRFEVAFTTARGSNDVRTADWLRLRRINVGRRTSRAMLRAELLVLTGRRRR